MSEYRYIACHAIVTVVILEKITSSFIFLTEHKIKRELSSRLVMNLKNLVQQNNTLALIRQLQLIENELSPPKARRSVLRYKTQAKCKTLN